MQKLCRRRQAGVTHRVLAYTDGLMCVEETYL